MEKAKLSYLVLILVICVVLTGFGCFYLGMHFNDEEVKKTVETPNNKKEEEEPKEISDETIIKEGTRLYEYLIDAFYGDDNVIKLDYDNYISSSDNRCNTGIGCILISNWDEVASKFTDNYLEKISRNNKLASDLGIKIIDNKGYLIDGFNDYIAPTLKEPLTINNKEDNRVVFNAIVNGNENVETKTFVIKLVNEKWLIDSFE